jgi:antitoxin Phd
LVPFPRADRLADYWRRHDMTSWTLQDAKAMFCEVVDRACREGPQVVTKRGEDAVVILSAEQFRQLTRRKAQENLAAFFRRSPLTELDPAWLARNRDKGREVAL